MLPEINKILYATDLKEKGSKNAFRFAVSLAMSNNAKIVMLHVMDELNSSFDAILRNSMSERNLNEIKARGIENHQAELQKRLQEFCAEECPGNEKSYPGGEPITVVKQGEPYNVILSTAKEYKVDLIVMGTRTHTGVGQVILGSTANKVIHQSKVPVLVYPL